MANKQSNKQFLLTTITERANGELDTITTKRNVEELKTFTVRENYKSLKVGQVKKLWVTKLDGEILVGILTRIQ